MQTLVYLDGELIQEINGYVEDVEQLVGALTTLGFTQFDNAELSETNEDAVEDTISYFFSSKNKKMG